MGDGISVNRADTETDWSVARFAGRFQVFFWLNKQRNMRRIDPNTGFPGVRLGLNRAVNWTVIWCGGAVVLWTGK